MWAGLPEPFRPLPRKGEGALLVPEGSDDGLLDHRVYQQVVEKCYEVSERLKSAEEMSHSYPGPTDEIRVNAADWLAAEAAKVQVRQWGGLRTGELASNLQLVGWIDGSSVVGGGSYGWCLVSRGDSCADLTLEGVGGGSA